MILNFKIVKVKTSYCDYLREYDNKVPYNMNKKETRPFIGILFNVDNFEYFAPLTSPKPKHLKMKNTIDFLKIKGGELGAVNFNNMIPVKEQNYELIQLNESNTSIAENKYKKLLREQLNWLNENSIQVKKKSSKLYKLYTNDMLSRNIKDRCCNFKLLEEKCNQYNEVFVK